MKVAIASEKKDIGSEVCPTAGRAPYYLIFDDDILVKTIKNPFAVGGGGAGFGVIQMLSNENIDMIISGSFGDNMISALKDKNMKHKSILNKTIKIPAAVELLGIFKPQNWVDNHSRAVTQFEQSKKC